MNKIYDAIGIGIGPFNLSLAALTNDLQESEILFFLSRRLLLIGIRECC